VHRRDEAARPQRRLPLDHLAALLGDPERRPEQRLGRGRAEADDDVGGRRGPSPPRTMDGTPRRAPVGRLVDAPLARRRLGEPEVLDDVGDVDVAAVDADVVERLLEQPAAGPTNGMPCLSSWSPGCSPTRAMRAADDPAEKTTRLAGSQSSTRGTRSPLRAAPPASRPVGRTPARPDARCSAGRHGVLTTRTAQHTSSRRAARPCSGVLRCAQAARAASYRRSASARSGGVVDDALGIAVRAAHGEPPRLVGGRALDVAQLGHPVPHVGTLGVVLESLPHGLNTRK
jgi:hypothetical protein